MTFISQKNEKYCFISCSEDKIKLGQCSCINNKQRKYSFMKTLELKLKKDVLIVDLPIYAKNVYMSGNSIIYNTDKSCIAKPINDDYVFLCKGSELTEEIASELCHNVGNCLTIEGDAYLDDEHDEDYFEFAQDAFISSVESKGFFWLEKECDNQFCENGKVDAGYNTFLNCQVCEEAEEKTFKAPLIFVKPFKNV